MELPKCYSDLVKNAAAFQCSKRLVEESYSDDGQSAMLCLVCGTMICTNSYCCQIEVGRKDSMDSGDKAQIGGFTQHSQWYRVIDSLCCSTIVFNLILGVVLVLEWHCGF